MSAADIAGIIACGSLISVIGLLIRVRVLERKLKRIAAYLVLDEEDLS